MDNIYSQMCFTKGYLCLWKFMKSQGTKMKQNTENVVITAQAKQRLSTAPLKCMPHSLKMNPLSTEQWTCSPLGISGVLIPFIF